MLRNKLVGLLLAAVCVLPAQAQFVQQSGNVTPGHAACWAINGAVFDCGAPGGGASIVGPTTANNFVSFNGSGSLINSGIDPTSTSAWSGLQNFNGGATAPTRSTGDSSTNVATTAFVNAGVFPSNCHITTNALATCINNLQNTPGGTVSAPFNFNTMAIVESLASGSNFKTGWSFVYDANGASGNATGLDSTINITSTVAGAYFITAMQASLFTAVPGANNLFAFNPQTILQTGATGYAQANGQETDVEVQSGASVAYLVGNSIAQLTGHANHASTKEGALVFTNQPGAVGWNNLIYVGAFNPSSITPMFAGGTIMVADASVTFANGIDFSAATVTSTAFKSPGFSVNGSGDIVSPALVNGGAGVQLGNGADIVTFKGTGGFAQIGSSTGTISFLTQAAAGTYNWNWPTTAGTSGYVLTSAAGGSSPMTWTQISGVYAPLASPTFTGTVTMPDASTWTSSLLTAVNVTVGGLLRSTYGTPTIASGACGATSNGSVAGSNQAGLITIGSATTTTCTVSFSTTLANAPNSCVIFPANATAAATGTTVARVSSIGTTNFVVTGSALASSNYYFICI